MIRVSSVSLTKILAYQRMEIYLRKNFKTFLNALEKDLEERLSTSQSEIMAKKEDVPIIMQLSSELKLVTLADFVMGGMSSQDAINYLCHLPVQTVISYFDHGL